MNTVNPKNGRKSPMISPETYEAVMENEDALNSAVLYDRDFTYVRGDRIDPAIKYFRADTLQLCETELLWIQDAREILPSAHRWQGS